MIKKINLHLLASVIIVIVISLVYGLFPSNILPKFFNFEVTSVDLTHVFRATMGLYIAMVILWVIGIVKPLYWKTATVSNVFFMMGLASGRIISLLVDGLPSISFSAGLVLELALGVWGIKNLKKYKLASKH